MSESSQPLTERTVVAGVPDLFFSSKISETARQLGVRVVFAQTQDVLTSRARDGARLVVLDLGAAQLDPLGLIRTLKADESTSATPIVAFANHERTDLITGAREAGCDQVMTRGAFSSGLPAILAGA